MIRFILILACFFGFYESCDSLWVSFTAPHTPAVISIDDLVRDPHLKLPRYLEFTDAIPLIYVCKEDLGAKAADGSPRCKDMKIPLLSSQQAEELHDGKPVRASAIFEATESVVERCNNSTTGDCLEGVSFRGISKGSMLNDLDDKDKQTLSEKKISVDDSTVFISASQELPSRGGGIAGLAISSLFAFLLIFCWPKKRPREEV